MHAAKVVPHEVEREGRRVVLDFLAEGVRQAREAAHRHPHRQVLPINAVRADALLIRIAGVVSDLQPMHTAGL